MKISIDKQKRNTITLIIAVLIVALAGIFAVKHMGKSEEGPRIRVEMNGDIVKDVPYGIEETFTFTNPETGLTNVLVCTTDGVYMESADCPDKICVHTGTIRPGDFIPIACLPNKLVVEVTE